jgi:subtilisin family serine protease
VKRLAFVAAVAATLSLAGTAEAARFAVGVGDGASLRRVAADLRTTTGGTVSWKLAKLRVLVVDAPDVRGVAAVEGVRYVEWLGTRRRRLAFVPSDPLVSKQWYVPFTHAFDLWPDPPAFPGVKVAIIDSGVDATHRDLQGKVFQARSFVGGSSATDSTGHGTFVAGIIAASIDNGEGIAGIGFPAQLLVAKVVRPDRSISLEAEADAIRWAVDHGARVINLSLGGVRDPLNPDRDTFSRVEADAVSYAARKGAVLVAAVGNGDMAPNMPWPYASYPAALPHVIGVSALGRDGSVPSFSDRDAVYNDIAAPGVDIYSTLPRALTKVYPTCSNQGYSDCGPDEFRHADGTSFAAPQVAAAAALVIAANPRLTASQVTAIVERSADDATPANGCKACAFARDSASGWGRLNIARAVVSTAETVPPTDRFETNDDAGPYAYKLFGRSGTLTASLDYWDDRSDVYRVLVPSRRRLSLTVSGAQQPPELRLWRPGTRSVVTRKFTRFRVSSVRPRTSGGRTRLTYSVPTGGGGFYFVELRLSRPGSGAYTLRWSR